MCFDVLSQKRIDLVKKQPLNGFFNDRIARPIPTSRVLMFEAGSSPAEKARVELCLAAS